jgi:hypothetical protein
MGAIHKITVEIGIFSILFSVWRMLFHVYAEPESQNDAFYEHSYSSTNNEFFHAKMIFFQYLEDLFASLFRAVSTVIRSEKNKNSVIGQLNANFNSELKFKYHLEFGADFIWTS